MTGSEEIKLVIGGWEGCAFFAKARQAANGIQALAPNLHVEIISKSNRDEYREWWFNFRTKFGPRAANHTSCPAAWINEDDFIGGCDDVLEFLRINFMAGAGVSRPPRATHENDLETEDVPMHGNLRGSQDDESTYDYDLVVVGGGSGGLATAKEAAILGAKVACLDFVKPSPAGSKWGLGGTCVNVGCIPKKLMHQAALLGDAQHSAKEFGWEVNPEHKISWETLVGRVQEYIASLNFKYRVDLRSKKVDYKNALGQFVDAHTMELTDKRGKKSTITSRRFIVAVGGRPTPLSIPGGEHAISSDDIFSYPTSPGKTLIIGASYIALECAGFISGFGYDVTVMVRSIFLRGFDQQCADMIGEYMQNEGTKFMKRTTPSKIEKLEDGRFKVFFVNAETGEEGSDIFDTVLAAIGRTADTQNLNLEAVGVKTDRSGKIICKNEQSSVPHVYAIGDVISGGLELTPVAIQAGRLLAHRLYNNATEGMDYNLVPTTVFTPIEYGCIGYAEEHAIEKFGEENIDVYHSYFSPLEWALLHDKPENACYAKLIVNKRDNDRVIGFHILGPNAGEITQGFATAMRLGASYDSFIRTVGIHPTMAEEFTTLSITKRSGVSADKGGC